jgi:hypothetical protein
MSETTETLFERLQSSRNAEAVRNDWTRTIEFCERHHAESHVFPLGLHSGYPSEMNFTGLRKRIKMMKPEIKRMLRLTIPEATGFSAAHHFSPHC